jgi:hypothetical protein
MPDAFKASNGIWVQPDDQGGLFLSNDPDDFDSGFDNVDVTSLRAIDEYRNQYRFGLIKHEDNRIFVLYLKDEPTPRAAYVAANRDQYDAYYDFVYSYCGSPLWDVIEGINYQRFMDETVKQLTDPNEYGDGDDYFGWDPAIVEIRANSEEEIDANSGLSILDVRKKAADELQNFALWSYRTDAGWEAERQDVIDAMLRLAK